MSGCVALSVFNNLSIGELLLPAPAAVPGSLSADCTASIYSGGGGSGLADIHACTCSRFHGHGDSMAMASRRPLCLHGSTARRAGGRGSAQHRSRQAPPASPACLSCATLGWGDPPPPTHTHDAHTAMWTPCTSATFWRVRSAPSVVLHTDTTSPRLRALRRKEGWAQAAGCMARLILAQPRRGIQPRPLSGGSR